MTLAALILTLLTMMLVGLMAGTFFTWTNAVMPGLDRLKSAASIAAFRGMNASILNRVFLVVFAFPTLTALVAAVLWLIDGETGAAVAMFLATAAYLGNQAGTGIVNVPMNNKLDKVDIPADPEAATKLWTDFSVRWVRWNSLRAFACLVSLGLTGLTLALI